MSEHKPIPFRPPTKSRACPVCGKASYSASGMHPQCAVAQADALTKADRKAAEAAHDKERRTAFSKPCPKCKRAMPARRYTCDCGHSFTAISPKPARKPAGRGRPVKPR